MGMIRRYSRKTLFSQNAFGLDSIQGLLEMSDWYDTANLKISFRRSDLDRPTSILSRIKQLEKEGHISVNLKEDKDNMLQLTSIALTVNGHRLLKELTTDSTWGNFRYRFVQLFWVVLTSVVTTLVVIWLKGE